jgi:hypothetical protein
MVNPQINNYDTSKIFVFGNEFQTATYTNPEGDDVTLLKDTVMGRVSATNEILPLESTASDGSQFPIGILADDYTVDYTESATLTFCKAGAVVESKIIFYNGTDTVETVVSSRTLGDRIQGDSLGINLVGGTQLTGEDNQ